MSEWISVKGRLPERRKWVLLACTDTENDEWTDPRIFVGYRARHATENPLEGEYECAYGDGYVPSGIEITHWMPLPKPPKE